MTCVGDGAGAFAEQVTALRQLAGQVQRALARSLCLAAAGIADHAQSRHYVNHLLHNVAGVCHVLLHVCKYSVCPYAALQSKPLSNTLHHVKVTMRSCGDDITEGCTAVKCIVDRCWPRHFPRQVLCHLHSHVLRVPRTLVPSEPRPLAQSVHINKSNYT